MLVVNPASGIQSVAELIALAKAKPGQVLHATVKGSLPHFASELFAQRAGIELTQVPYQGSQQSVTDVIAGRATMTFSPASSVVGQIAAGKLKALATAAKKRPSALPDVPTMAEAGMPDFDTSLWFGLLAPAGTPRPVDRQGRRGRASGDAYAGGAGNAAQAGLRAARRRTGRFHRLHARRDRPLDERRARRGVEELGILLHLPGPSCRLI